MDPDWDKLLAAYGERVPSVVVKPASPAEAPGRTNIAVAILILLLGFRARR